MADIFRKKALDSANEDEKLDKMMVVTPKSLWVAILGGVFIMIVVVFWSIYGVMPIKVSAKGIYIPKQTTYSLDSEVSGIIESISVSSGDNVKIGDVLYTLNSEYIKEEIDELNNRISIVEAITPYSKDDVINSDTQSLIEIKYSISQTSSSLYEEEYLLDLIEEEKDSAEKELSKAKNNYLSMQKKSLKVEEILETISNISDADLISLGQKWQEYDADKTDSAKRQAYLDALNAIYPDAFNPEISPEANLEKCKSNSISSKNNLNEAQADYEVAKSKLTTLENQIVSTDMDISSTKKGNDQKINNYVLQFDDVKTLLLNSLNEQIDKYKDLIDKNTIYSPTNGIISDVKIGVGTAVGQGSTTITIRQQEDENVVVCYVGLSDGKKIKPGMIAKLYPSNVSKYEYGNIEASVLSVDDYVTSVYEIQNDLGDDTLTEAFLQQGPIVGVKFKLEEDDTTLSGYKWSSNKARDIIIPFGTIVDADIIIEEKKPITMLIPYLREKIESLGSKQ